MWRNLFDVGETAAHQPRVETRRMAKQLIPGGRKAVIKPSKGGELRKRETKKIKVGSLSGTLLAFCDPFRSVPSRPFFSHNAPSN